MTFNKQLVKKIAAVFLLSLVLETLTACTHVTYRDGKIAWTDTFNLPI